MASLSHSGGASNVPATASFIVSLGKQFRQWRTVSAQRRALRLLDQDALHDIGLRADQARREAARPFWR